MIDVMTEYPECFSREQIASAVARIAKPISEWAKSAEAQSNSQLLAVCILRGGMFFFTDLLREISTSTEPTFIRTWGYSGESNSQLSGVRVALDDVGAEGRTILIVDDICDTGSTLKKLHGIFRELGAREVKTAALIHRKTASSVFSPDWAAFEYSGDEWFVGYGMDDRERYRNLASVCLIPKTK